MTDRPDNPDQFIRKPDRQTTPQQRTAFENFVRMTVNRLRRATHEQVEETIMNVTTKQGFVKRVGGRLAAEFPKTVKERLATERRR